MSKEICNSSFDWDEEEDQCNLDEDYTTEFCRLDSSKSIASRSTGCSEKMIGSPLKNKGQVKVEDVQEFIQQWPAVKNQIKREKYRKMTLGHQTISAERRKMPQFTQISSIGCDKNNMSSKMTMDIRHLLRELADYRKQTVVMEKSWKFIDLLPDEECKRIPEPLSPELGNEYIVTMNDIEANN